MAGAEHCKVRQNAVVRRTSNVWLSKVELHLYEGAGEWSVLTFATPERRTFLSKGPSKYAKIGTILNPYSAL